MAEPIRKLGPYRLLTKLGLGAFGVVWLAEKQTAIATTKVALKLSRDENIDLEAFRQEAAIWVQASGHPNVLPLIDADIYDDQVVIVSEYVPDGSLAKWLKEHGGTAPSIEAACEMIEGILAGLAHLHEQRIIHRDLKPDNILLQRGTPRLADFGIARLLRTGSYSTDVSGTLAYMAPEAFDGKRNELTDIWAVGVIFYQLLAGRLPYDQEDTPAFIGAIMRYDAPSLPDAIPEPLRLVVMKALHRDPAHRCVSAAAMRKELRAAQRALWLKEQADSEAVTSLIPKESRPTSLSVSPEPPPVASPSRSEIGLEGNSGQIGEGLSGTIALEKSKRAVPPTVASIPLSQETDQPTIAAPRPTVSTPQRGITESNILPALPLIKPGSPESYLSNRALWLVIGSVVLIVIAIGIALLVKQYSGADRWVSTESDRTADQATGIAASVNGRKIMMQEVERAIQQASEGKQAQLSANSLAQARLQTLDKLIDREALFGYASQEKLLPSEDEITNTINKQKQESGITDEEFTRRLKAQNMTSESLREEAKKDLAIQRLQQKYLGSANDQEKDVLQFALLERAKNDAKIINYFAMNLLSNPNFH